MGRTISGTLAGILAGTKRDLDYTLDLVFSDQSFYFATSPIASLNGNTYTNDLATPSEIKNTLEAPTDGVGISLQNLDRVLGQHLATYWQKWRTAAAVVGRNYYAVGSDGVRTGTSAWVEMFRGSVEQPNADDSQVTFTLIPDTISPGLIVAVRTCGKNCPHKFKGPACGYTGGETVCNHCLVSPAGCDGRANAHRYGGTEHRYDSAVSIPGTGGNIEPYIPPPPPCSRLDQYVDVRGPDGNKLTKMVCFFTEDDWLWDPIRGDFFPTKRAYVVKDQPIWELITDNGAIGYSSFSHHVMPNKEHPTGLVVETLTAYDEVLSDIDGEMLPSYAALSRPTGDRGDVMFIEMEAGHHYSSGDTTRKKIVAHNNKRDPLEIL